MSIPPRGRYELLDPQRVIETVERLALRIEERFPGFFQLSDRSFFSCDLGCVKPDPEIFRRVLREIGAPAERCVFLDDTPGHVAMARKLGLHGYVFERGKTAQLRAAWTDLMNGA